MTERKRSSAEFLEDTLKQRSSVVCILLCKTDSYTTGSGFVIKCDAEKAIIMTCKHTVESLEQDDIFKVRYMVDGEVQELPAKVIFMSSTELDVALVEVLGLSSLATLSFNEKTLEVYEEVVAVGYINPHDMWEDTALARLPASSPGAVDTTKEGYMGFTASFSCCCTPGTSGGPVLNDGGVVAMVCEGVPGTIWGVTTTGMKSELESFLQTSRVQVGTDSTMQQLLALIP